MTDPERYHLFQRALHRTEWTVQQLWVGTIASGGTLSVVDLEAFLYGLTPLPPAQQDVIANTLNERLRDLYESVTIPYLVALTPSVRPAEDPLAVLRQHLHAADDGPDPAVRTR